MNACVLFVVLLSLAFSNAFGMVALCLLCFWFCVLLHIFCM